MPKTGLTVRCELDTGQYPSGVVVSDAEMAAINIKRAEFHGEWNYTISKQSSPKSRVNLVTSPKIIRDNTVRFEPRRADLCYPPLSFCLAKSAFAWIRLRSASDKVAVLRIFRHDFRHSS